MYLVPLRTYIKLLKISVGNFQMTKGSVGDLTEGNIQVIVPESYGLSVEESCSILIF
jgi:hypothetical protein